MGRVVIELTGHDVAVAEKAEWRAENIDLQQYLDAVFPFEELSAQMPQPELVQVEKVLKVHKGKILSKKLNDPVPHDKGYIY